VTERRQEGVTENDATVSSVTSMLIELGLRVYRIQREKKESGFNQMEYNKLMLDNISRVRFMCSEIMNMSMLNQESVASGHFTIEKIKPAMEKFVNEQVGIFFHNDDKTE
ncbi:relaxosome protein TraM, partial [Escherichia coli]|nr:relaxosome protein TraM [Escherichia coli]